MLTIPGLTPRLLTQSGNRPERPPCGGLTADRQKWRLLRHTARSRGWIEGLDIGDGSHRPGHPEGQAPQALRDSSPTSSLKHYIFAGLLLCGQVELSSLFSLSTTAAQLPLVCVTACQPFAFALPHVHFQLVSISRNCFPIPQFYRWENLFCVVGLRNSHCSARAQIRFGLQWRRTGASGSVALSGGLSWRAKASRRP